MLPAHLIIRSLALIFTFYNFGTTLTLSASTDETFCVTVPQGRHEKQSTTMIRANKATVRVLFAGLFQSRPSVSTKGRKANVGVERKIVKEYREPRVVQSVRRPVSRAARNLSDIGVRRRRPYRPYRPIYFGRSCPGNSVQDHDRCCTTCRYFKAYQTVISDQTWYVMHFPDQGMYQYVQEGVCGPGTCGNCVQESALHYLVVSSVDPDTVGDDDPLSIKIKGFWFNSYCRCQAHI